MGLFARERGGTMEIFTVKFGSSMEVFEASSSRACVRLGVETTFRTKAVSAVVSRPKDAIEP
jgi:hypothetical protein